MLPTHQTMFKTAIMPPQSLTLRCPPPLIFSNANMEPLSKAEQKDHAGMRWFPPKGSQESTFCFILPPKPKSKPSKLTKMPSKSEQEHRLKDAFMSLIDDPTFSDITVIAGLSSTKLQRNSLLRTHQKEYKLHRNILCLKSSVFRQAALSSPTPKECIVQLPMLQPHHFDVTLKWLYGGGFSLTDLIANDRHASDFKAVYESTKTLGIPILRREIQAAVKEYAIEQAQLPEEKRQIPGGLSLLEEMCSCSDDADWDALLEVMEAVFPKQVLCRDWLRKVSGSSYNAQYLLALAVTALQTAVHGEGWMDVVPVDDEKDMADADGNGGSGELSEPVGSDEVE